MGLSGFPVIIESQAIMVSTRLAIGKLIHALEVWSDDPRLPNIDLYSTNPLQPTLQQYSANLGNTSSTHCAHGVWCCIAIQRQYSALHSTALQRSTLYSALIIESQVIMVSTRVAIVKLIHALEVWSNDPRLPNIEPLQHEPSTADSTAIQRCIGQYIFNALCPRGVVLYSNTAQYSALHSTALQRSTLGSSHHTDGGWARQPLWDRLGPLGTAWDRMGPPGTAWDRLGPLGPLGPPGISWDRAVGNCRTVGCNG